ncbi:MAG: ABC transporter permease [Pseudomonadota bacterium]|nr:ABC transporter permease [Pseudomonadota bacterium]
MADAAFTLERRTKGAVLALSGDWTSSGLGRAGDRLREEARDVAEIRLDLKKLGRFDTAGAFALNQAVAGREVAADFDSRPDVRRLVDLVAAAHPKHPRRRRPRPTPILHVFARTGEAVTDIGRQMTRDAVFNGRLAVTLARSLMNPRRFRVAPIINQMDSTGLNAIPIVATLSFFVGAVVAFLGASLLSQFGAQVFTVELIGIAVLREFGVLLTAIILAGRSASSYAAAIGAMKMNQEIDAMEVMGVDPFEALVLPRFIAMQLMFPLLSFVSIAAGLSGGMLVCWLSLDLSPAFFFQRLLDNVGATNFWVGIVKAPVFAAVIAAVGARQGLQVGGDVESLGARVTAAVVQAIFAIIVLDAIFAMLATELGF